MSQELWRLSAVELSLAIRRREVSARQVAESVLARIDETKAVRLLKPKIKTSFLTYPR